MAKKETKTGSTTVSSTTCGSKCEDRAKKIFGDYPDINELYFTSDGMAFFSENDAKNHAATLKDGEVKTIKRQ